MYFILTYISESCLCKMMQFISNNHMSKDKRNEQCEMENSWIVLNPSVKHSCSLSTVMDSYGRLFHFNFFVCLFIFNEKLYTPALLCGILLLAVRWLLYAKVHGTHSLAVAVQLPAKASCKVVVCRSFKEG